MTGAVTFLVVAVIGGIAQVIDGSLGMGFGVFASATMIGVGFVPAVAVAVVNTAKVFTGLASGLSHWSLGNVRGDWLLPLLLGGVPGGFLGAYLLTSIPPEVARPWVGLLLLLMGLLIVYRACRWKAPCAIQAWDKKCEHCPQGKWQWVAEKVKNNPLSRLMGLGFIAALVNGLTGAYGPVATSGILLIEKGHPRHAIGTANLAEFFVAATVATTILLRIGLSQFPTGLTLALAAGGIVTAPLAAYLCRRLPQKMLTLLVGLALIALNLKVVTWVLH